MKKLDKYSNQIAVLIASGTTAHELADIFKINYATVLRFVRDLQVKPQRPKKTGIEERDNELIIFYLENHTLEECGQKFGGLSRERIRQILNKNGIKPRSSTPLVFRETLTNDRPHRFTTKERFWANVEIADKNSCWLWKGAKNNVTGYGSFSFKGKNQSAHRLSYLLSNKKSAKNCVLHSCDNRICVNPAHLRDGTQAENVRDRQTRGYDKWYAAMMNGHRQSNRSLRYSESEIKEMKRLRESGLSFNQLDKMFKVPSWGYAKRILSGQFVTYQKFL